jgi:DNA-binding XRE family transcriptional regulator
MDPERNHGGKTPGSGDDSPALAAVAVEEAPRDAGEPLGNQAPVIEDARPKASKASRRTRPKAGTHPNNVRKLRQGAMMSKAELARRAGVSPLTIDRVEAGCPCRMDTKRKILEALGLKPSARTEVWPDIDAQS